MVRLLWLDPGREEGSIELSLLRLVGLESDLDKVLYPLGVALPLLLNVEFCRLRP